MNFEDIEHYINDIHKEENRRQEEILKMIKGDFGERVEYQGATWLVVGIKMDTKTEYKDFVATTYFSYLIELQKSFTQKTTIPLDIYLRRGGREI